MSPFVVTAATVFVDCFHPVSVKSEAGALTVRVVEEPAVELADGEPETALQAEPVAGGPECHVSAVVVAVVMSAVTLVVELSAVRLVVWSVRVVDRSVEHSVAAVYESSVTDAVLSWRRLADSVSQTATALAAEVLL